MIFHKQNWFALLICASLVGFNAFGCGDGEDGLDGAQGAPGEVGPDGEKGPDGDRGPDGADGADGQDGEDGQDGADGEDGLDTLVEKVRLDPGGVCEFGGLTVTTGVDADGDGLLSEEEIAHHENICAPEPGPGACDEALFLTDITGLDQPFYAGMESEPVTVNYLSDSALTLHLIGDADITTSQGDGEFTFTPGSTADSMELTLVAASTCGSSLLSFTIDDIRAANTYVRFVNLYSEAPAADFVFETDGDINFLTSLPFADVSTTIELFPDDYSFEVYANDISAGSLAPQEFALDQHYTIAAYSDGGQLAFLVLEDDIDAEISPDMVRFRAANLANDAGPVDILDVDEQPLVEGIGYGLASDPQELSEAIETLLIDDRVYSMNSYDFEGGDNINAFIFSNQGNVGLLLQYINAAFIAVFYPPLSADDFPFSFENGVMPPGFETSGFDPWTYSDAPWSVIEDVDAPDGTHVLQSGTVFDDGWNGGWSNVGFEVTLDEPTTLAFDWKVSSEEIYDRLLFCVGETTCPRVESIAFISGEVDWETFEYEITEPGVYFFNWTYSKDGSDSAGADTGWIDNIRIIN